MASSLLAAGSARAPVGRAADSLRADLHGPTEDQPQPCLLARTVGLCEIQNQVWLVGFPDFDHEFFDEHEGRVDPAMNRFEPEKVSTMFLE